MKRNFELEVNNGNLVQSELQYSGRDHSELMLFRADGFFARLLGLLGKSALAPNHALWLPRCSGVHTFGMQFPIGVFFVDRAGAICKIIACLKPNRIAVCRSAVSVVEMAAFENGQEKRLKQAIMQALIRSQS